MQFAYSLNNGSASFVAWYPLYDNAIISQYDITLIDLIFMRKILIVICLINMQNLNYFILSLLNFLLCFIHLY